MLYNNDWLESNILPKPKPSPFIPPGVEPQNNVTATSIFHIPHANDFFHHDKPINKIPDNANNTFEHEIQAYSNILFNSTSGNK